MIAECGDIWNDAHANTGVTMRICRNDDVDRKWVVLSDDFMREVAGPFDTKQQALDWIKANSR